MCPKRVKKSRGKFKSRNNRNNRNDRNCMYANEEEEEEIDEQTMSGSDEEIGFVAIKENKSEKMALVSQVEKKSYWIIDNGCSHHMTSDMNKFVEFQSCDGGTVRVGNNATCFMKGIGSITLDGKNNTENVYFVDGLKHNLLSLGKLVDKSYQLQFIEKTCMIRDKDGKVIGIGRKSRGNVF